MKKWIAVLRVIIALLLITGAALAESGGALRVTTLSGAEEVPPADPDGSGFATIMLNKGSGTVCWEVTYEGIEPPTAAHIHSAPFGVNGPDVIPLNPISSGCAQASPELIRSLTVAPAVFYVTGNNATYPGGAIRGHLSVPGR